MIFAPVRLGEASIDTEVLAADKKSCKRFGPCGVGKEALYLNSYFIDRHYYVAFSSVRRVFKRVAMSQGGFSGKGAFGAIPYLVVQYDGGKEKQCTFKREEDVDAMLACIGKMHPEIPTLSVGGAQRMQEKAEKEAKRYLDELTPEAQSAKEELEKAQKFLSGYPELTNQLSKAARAKRVNQHTNPAYRWVALAIVLAGAGVRYYLLAQRRRFRRIFCALRLCRDLLLFGRARAAHGEEQQKSRCPRLGRGAGQPCPRPAG